MQVCALLLKHGANVNAANHQGRTPLWRAAFKGMKACVTLLLEVPGARHARDVRAWRRKGRGGGRRQAVFFPLLHPESL